MLKDLPTWLLAVGALGLTALFSISYYEGKLVMIDGKAWGFADTSVTLESFIASGRVNLDNSSTSWNLEHGTGVRTTSKHVSFPNNYSKPPAVTVSLAHIDSFSKTSIRVNVYPENISEHGFDMVFYTWSDTVVYGLTGNWVAHGNRVVSK